MNFSNERTLLIKLRNKHNLSQAQLGRMIGIIAQNISNAERGKAGLSVERWAKIVDLGFADINEVKESLIGDFTASVYNRLTKGLNNE
jgi:transcriptional regulator with XRE-family HTH domain